MQPRFLMWYNPNRRFEYHGGSSAISIEQLQESSPEVGEQETSGVCEGGCHWLNCRQNILRMTSDRNCLVNTDIARIVDPRRALNCQSCCYGIFAMLHFVLGSHLILERNMSFLCLFVVLKSRDASFKGYFDKNIFFWSNSNIQN